MKKKLRHNPMWLGGIAVIIFSMLLPTILALTYDIELPGWFTPAGVFIGAFLMINHNGINL